MKHPLNILLLLLLATESALLFCVPSLFMQKIVSVQSAFDIQALFPTTRQAIEALTMDSLQSAHALLTSVLTIEDNQRTFNNTVKAFDELQCFSDSAITTNILKTLELVHPIDTMRSAARTAGIQLKDFYIDYIANNKELYRALMAYFNGNMHNESLADDQLFFVQATIDEFQRNGMSLHEQDLSYLKVLKKEMSVLEVEFIANISKDVKKIAVSKEELKGLDASFVDQLPIQNGLYMLGVDYPTYFYVMGNCLVETTRKQLFLAFENRGYPDNEFLLKQIIAKRDQFAHMLGFSSYAEFDISNQMAHSVEQVEQFLYDIITHVATTEMQHIKTLITELPDQISLTPEGKIKHWDLMFLRNYHKKKHYAYDEAEIIHYFPLDSTIARLLNIYEQFMNLRFICVEHVDFWHEDVKLIEVYDNATETIIGYLLLDLFPRPGKYTHARHAALIPATYINNQSVPALSLVIANLSKVTRSGPALLRQKDIRTFFHEFGHALHALLGRTRLASHAGTKVKRDFVEMPSQMFEEWLLEPEILQKLSCHYKTGEQLSHAAVAKIIHAHQAGLATSVYAQACKALFSLELFKDGRNKDFRALSTTLYEHMYYGIAYEAQAHTYASFDHLIGYGAKYYGYLWSKVFAVDIFQEIKKNGLSNPVIGKKYICHILQQGGSKPPEVLIENFLGRKATMENFWKYIEIKDTN